MGGAEKPILAAPHLQATRIAPPRAALPPGPVWDDMAAAMAIALAAEKVHKVRKVRMEGVL